MCGDAGGHQVLSLKAWEQAKDRGRRRGCSNCSAPIRRTWRTILRALQFAVGYQDEPLFNKIADTFAAERTEDMAIQAQLGFPGYAFFLRWDRARAAYQAAARRLDDTDARSASQLALALLKLETPPTTPGPTSGTCSTTRKKSRRDDLPPHPVLPEAGRPSRRSPRPHGSARPGLSRSGPRRRPTCNSAKSRRIPPAFRTRKSDRPSWPRAKWLPHSAGTGLPVCRGWVGLFVLLAGVGPVPRFSGLDRPRTQGVSGQRDG